MATYSDWQQRELDAESGRALDRRQASDIVIIARYFGIDLPGAQFLQPDGSWQRSRLLGRKIIDGHRTARRFTRPEAEAWIAEHPVNPPLGLHLWVA